MARWTVAPDARLSDWLECIAFSIDEPGDEPAAIRVVPDGCSDLLFYVDAEVAGQERRSNRGGRSCSGELFGAKTTPLLVSSLNSCNRSPITRCNRNLRRSILTCCPVAGRSTLVLTSSRAYSNATASSCLRRQPPATRIP